MTAEPTRPKYSVVVPVYKSDRTLVELVKRLRVVFEETLEASYEILLVDDGSDSPETWETCERLARQHVTVGSIQLMRNYGKPGAVLCGLGHARGQWIVTIDDDLQQRPEDIPLLVEHEDHDVVVAHFRNRATSLGSRAASWLKSQFDRAILRLPCRMSPLKLFRSEVAAGMLTMRTSYPFLPALMAHVTDDFVSVPVTHAVSRHGRSRYSWTRRVKQFSNLVISNSSLLLRLLGAVGLIVGSSGLGFAVVILFRKLAGQPIQPGWSSLVVINLVFGGLILIALGLIGEYLLRILEGTSRKPAYFARRVVGTGEGTGPLPAVFGGSTDDSGVGRSN
ncbi:MAG: glycosyltransferase family 2 protein [bacterium]|nr:glycosyltransferase family 2 protein [bacterium]